MPQLLGTLLKATQVLDALEESAPVGVRELSRRLGMEKSAVSRILLTLNASNYVRVTDGGGYDLGLRLFELGRTLQERMPFRQMVIPFVDEIARETGETVFAVHYNQHQIAYLYDCVSDQDIRLGERTGARESPWTHPAGIAMLAHHDEPEVLAFLAAARRIQRKGLPTIDRFRRELDSARQRGYSDQCDQEKHLIAVPVLGDTSPVSSALMIGGPAFRIAPSRSKALARLLIRQAADLSGALGWTDTT